MRITFQPKYQFAAPITPSCEWFAWYPVKMWWGEWVWLRKVSRQLHQKNDYLDGPDYKFWSYCHN